MLRLYIFVTVFEGAPLIMMLQQGCSTNKFRDAKPPNTHLVSISEEHSGTYFKASHSLQDSKEIVFANFATLVLY
jgi:hypothetical protein